MTLRDLFTWKQPLEMEKRGGAGYGITTTASDHTSYLTGPPSSTNTKDRGLHPEIAGSTGGFIGLVSGIAIVVVLGVILGFFFYNRHRRRIGSKRGGIPSLTFTRSSVLDPYADSSVGVAGAVGGDVYGDTPSRSGHFNMGDRGRRPHYIRQRSSEWEIPSPSPVGTPVSVSRGSIGSRGSGDGVMVEMPYEPDEAAYPLRSRSPRPTSPNPHLHTFPESTVHDHGVKENGKGKEKARAPVNLNDVPIREGVVGNPFEPEMELDPTRLSPRIGEYQGSNWGRLPSETTGQE